MSKKKKKSTEQILLERKRKTLTDSIKSYWVEQDRLNKQYNEFISTLGITNLRNNVPPDLTSYIWLLKDGAVFMRFKTESALLGMHIMIENITIDKFISKGIIIPIRDYNINIPNVKVIDSSFENTQFQIGDRTFNVEYLIYNHIRYDEPQKLPTLSKALVDFRLTVLGIMMQNQTDKKDKTPNDSVLVSLKSRLEELKRLLLGEVREEALQQFLLENPFILKPSSVIIPKQKLGEDFVTDFILVNTLDQGSKYTMVEIEKSCHNILTKDGQLTAEVQHAISQTRDWEIWLESNKAYLQSKLPNFETPEYLIIIGRSNKMNPEHKAKFRSYNRMYEKTVIISYDDLVSQIEEFISSLELTTKI